MIDILNEAREYTREDFLNEAAKSGSLFLCPRYSGLNQKCLSSVYDEKKCKECWKEAVKDITFKSEEFTAICINDKTTRDKKVKVLGITEGKEYQVKPSGYANYYELVNDMGNVETYFMDRFEILENPKWIEKFYSENGKKAIENIMVEIFGGHSMEDKIIKVRCIDAKGTIVLEKNKIYTVKKEYESSYLLEEIKNHDYQFDKARFEKVEDVLMVECIDNEGYEGHLILNKKYIVLEEDVIHYFVKNELANKTGYRKERFKPVEPQKEVNEQSTIERLRKELEGEGKANEFLEKDCNRYKELAEARGENNKKFDEENTNLNELIENKDIKIEKLERLKEVINEENEQLTNEYSNKIIIAEQEINRLKESLTVKNDIAEKYFKENENLKDAVKKLSEVL